MRHQISRLEQLNNMINMDMRMVFRKKLSKEILFYTYNQYLINLNVFVPRIYTKTKIILDKSTVVLDYNEIKCDPKRLEHLESLRAVLTDLLGNLLVPNEAELLSMYGRVSIIILII